jgi:hypothetical protein
VRAGVSSRWWKVLLLRCDDGGSHACCPAMVVGADDDGPDLDIFSPAPLHAQHSAEMGVRARPPNFTNTSSVRPEQVWRGWSSSVINLP